MRDLYGDQFDTARLQGPAALIPEGLRRLAGAAIFLGLILAMGLWSYRLGTRDASEVPIVRAMAGPARLAPDEPGGLQAAHQGLEVNVVLAGRPAPEPEAVAAPVPPPVLTDEDKPQGELAAVEAVPAPQEDAPAPPPEPEPEAETAMPLPQSETDALIAELAAEQAPGTVGLAPFTLPSDAPVEVAVVDAAAAGPRPRGRPVGLRAARPPVEARESPAPAPAAAVAAPREVASLRSGARLVQLGAFDSAVNARDAWDRLVGRHGDLLGSKSLYVERTTANARVFYRLRVAGFEDTEQTRAICEALKGRGVDCIPVTLQ